MKKIGRNIGHTELPTHESKTLVQAMSVHNLEMRKSDESERTEILNRLTAIEASLSSKIENLRKEIDDFKKQTNEKIGSLEKKIMTLKTDVGILKTILKQKLELANFRELLQRMHTYFIENKNFPKFIIVI